MKKTEGTGHLWSFRKTKKNLKKEFKRSLLTLTAGALVLTASPSRVMAKKAAAAETEIETETGAEIQEKAGSGLSGIIFSTDYPGITTQADNTVTFNLHLTNEEETDTDLFLSAEGLPEGWSGAFKGSGSEVSKVHVHAHQTRDDAPSLSYTLSVPEDAKEDTTVITLAAVSKEGQASLPLTVKVTAEEAVSTEGEFTADYPEQQGSSSASFSFSTSLKNNSSENAVYALSAEGLPEGWNASFTPSGASQTASVPVDAGASSSITVAVSPAQDVQKGEYTFNAVASSGTETLKLPLTVSITGTYGIRLSTPSGNLRSKAYAGEPAKIALQIDNTGNVDLMNVTLSSTVASDWNAEFSEETIDRIEAGSSKEVTVTITPSQDATIGEYIAEIKASTKEASSISDLDISIQNHTAWGLIAVAIIAALILGLLVIIRKFGRR